VEVGYVSLTHSVITRGLEIGNKVIIQRPQELKVGSPVKIIETQNTFNPLASNPKGEASGSNAGASIDDLK
jgi:hypothetical protein